MKIETKLNKTGESVPGVWLSATEINVLLNPRKYKDESFVLRAKLDTAVHGAIEQSQRENDSRERDEHKTVFNVL